MQQLFIYFAYKLHMWEISWLDGLSWKLARGWNIYVYIYIYIMSIVISLWGEIIHSNDKILCQIKWVAIWSQFPLHCIALLVNGINMNSRKQSETEKSWMKQTPPRSLHVKWPWRLSVWSAWGHFRSAVVVLRDQCRERWVHMESSRRQTGTSVAAPGVFTWKCGPSQVTAAKTYIAKQKHSVCWR